MDLRLARWKVLKVFCVRFEVSGIKGHMMLRSHAGGAAWKAHKGCEEAVLMMATEKHDPGHILTIDIA